MKKLIAALVIVAAIIFIGIVLIGSSQHSRSPADEPVKSSLHGKVKAFSDGTSVMLSGSERLGGVFVTLNEGSNTAASVYRFNLEGDLVPGEIRTLRFEKFTPFFSSKAYDPYASPVHSITVHADGYESLTLNF